MNKLIITGRLTADPEIRYTQDNKAVARFNFAVNRRFRREGDPEADFFACVAFGKIAETIEKCNVYKGVKLLIDGEVRNNNYTDKNGVKHYGTQVMVNSFEFAEGKKTAEQSGRPYGSNQGGSAPADGFMSIPDGLEGELPF